MRDEKEERKKQARSNKQTRQSNTAHPTHDTLYSRQSALPHVRDYGMLACWHAITAVLFGSWSQCVCLVDNVVIAYWECGEHS